MCDQVSGSAPVNLHGSYCAVFSTNGITADQIVAFGGGSHVAATDCVSRLDLGRLNSDRVAVWSHLAGSAELVSTYGLPENELQPSARYAGAAVSWRGWLVTLSGRTGGLFHSLESLWCFDVAKMTWGQWAMAGTAPSARVTCCVAAAANHTSSVLLLLLTARLLSAAPPQPLLGCVERLLAPLGSIVEVWAPTALCEGESLSAAGAGMVGCSTNGRLSAGARWG